ncbi:MAG: Hcp family type VI secretion system effector [Terracidiphilus sp.]|jgi:type VI secretion system secreted protein Hcp
MPLNAYLTLKGQKQGAIKGGVTQEGREGSILVHSFSNEILSPRDPQSGLPTGKRMHKPIFILKEVDRASPQLWEALVNNENLTQWELKFWSTSTTGKEKQTYTIELVNASIASIREYMPDNEDPAKANLPLLEEISFTYQKIEWTWMDPTVSASDDWETPVA